MPFWHALFYAVNQVFLSKNEPGRLCMHRLIREVLCMLVYFITVRSVTFGQRAESVLRKGGMKCSLQRTPRWMEEQGCGYCLRMRTDDIRPAVELLRAEQVPFRRVYAQTRSGDVEEVRL